MSWLSKLLKPALTPVERKVKKSVKVLLMKISELEDAAKIAYKDIEKLSKEEIRKHFTKDEILAILAKNKTSGELLETLLSYFD